MTATLAAPRKKGGGNRTMSKKNGNGADGVLGLGDKPGIFIKSLKATLIPLALAVLAVGVAVRWGKRDEKGKPGWAFPFIALSVAWLLPEYIFLKGNKTSAMGGWLTTTSVRAAGAFAFLIALTFDEILGAVVGRRKGEKDTVVAKLFWWGASAFGGEKNDNVTNFMAKVPARSSGGSNGGSNGNGGSQPDPQSQPRYDEFAYQQPQQQPSPTPSSGGGGGGDNLASAIFGFLGQAAQAAPGIISAFSQPSTNAGQQAGLAGPGNPYMTLARRRAA